MSKVAIVYWSSTGNTEAMAEAVYSTKVWYRIKNHMAVPIVII